jgi:hypothetical protein
MLVSILVAVTPSVSAASIGTYDQCSNDLGTGYSSGDTGCRWINGNLQSNNAVYFEGDATVQRLWLDGYVPGSTHNITLKYGTTKGGKHAYDFLTAWDWSENWVTVADRCQDVTGCTTASETTFAIPNDPVVNDTAIELADAGPRVFTIRGGTITAATTPVIVSGTYGGDSETVITITFTVAASGDMCTTKGQSTTCGIALWFGAHVSKTQDWQAFDGTTGATSISGSPYHVALDAMDGASVGSRDNQMQSGTIIVPLGSISLDKVTIPSGNPTTFNFTTTNLPSPTSLGLTDASTPVAWLNLTNGNYTITENVPSGWLLTERSCTGATTSVITNISNGVRVALLGGENIACTFTNTLQQAHLTLRKVVINDNGGTATVSSWTLSAAGPTPISGVNASAAVTNAAVNAGTYNVSESGPSGYTATLYSCVNNGGGPVSGNSITLAPGDNAVCTITNNDNAAHLIVIKHVINDNGGTASASDFTMQINGVTASGGNSFAGAESPGTDKTLTTIGSYNVTETGITGYTQVSASADCSGTIALGETKTCTITNNDIQPKLTLNKIVINDNGGTAVIADFALFVGTTQVTSGVQNGFDAGSYVVNETQLAGYSASGWTGDCTSNGAVTLNPGDVKVCNITNDDNAAHLIVIKHVVNDNGGDNVAADFTMSINGINASGGNSFAGSESGINKNVNPGTYNVTESSVTGYTQTSASADCTGTIALGETKTCTITNDDDPASITLVKVVINNNGGTAGANDFGLLLNGNVVSNGTTTVVDSNTAHTVNESGLFGYSFVSLTGDTKCPSTLGGTTQNLDEGEHITCIITNDDIPPQLTVIKHVINDDGGTAVASDFTMHVAATNPSQSDFPGNESGDTITLDQGSYTVNETGLPGYAESDGADCTGTIAVGESKTCTITNDDIAAHLIVIKHVVNDNGGTASASDFTMSINGVTASGGNTFAGQESPGINKTLTTVGAYNITESGMAGYTQTDASADCSGTIALGETKTCTITNDDNAPSLILNKIVVNDNGGTATESDWTLTASGTTSISGPGATGDTDVVSNASFAQGTYSLSESSGPTSYTASTWNCVGGTQNGTQIMIGLGESATCTITNNDVQPLLTLIKHVVNNENGTLQVSNFSLFVNATPVTSGVTNGFNAGAYIASETQHTGYVASNWSGDCATDGTVTLYVGDNKTCEITNDDVHATAITHASNNTLALGGSITDTVTVTGYFNGNVYITPTGTVTFYVCSGTSCLTGGTQVGSVKVLDENGSATSDPFTPLVGGTYTFRAEYSGDALYPPAIDINSNTLETFVIIVPVITRTLGFWQTHTAFTQHIYHDIIGVNNLFIGENVAATNTTHRGKITTDGQLFGAYYSSIPKKTTGVSRTSIDQARMVLLQQLLTAKLNCAAFNCSASIQTLVTNADVAYKNGSSNILLLAMQLNTYNNLGDNSTIPSALGSIGTGTPKTSEGLANKVFWDTP